MFHLLNWRNLRMICTAISEKDFDKCMEMSGMCELAEIRIDLTRFTVEQTAKLFSAHKNLIATCRPERYKDNERLELLKTAIESGAKYADIEIESNRNVINEIKRCTSDNNCDMIISYHNFDNTPSQKELEEIIGKCFYLGADVAKIACTVNSASDNATILSLFQLNKRIVALGMGSLGKITRIVSPLLGAEFTFAAPDTSVETAPGQLSTEQMISIYNELRKYGILI